MQRYINRSEIVCCSPGTSAICWRAILIQTAIVAATTSASVKSTRASGFICISAVSAA